jgi:tripartite-type tricarboxylate transporter receptor subunit TctC
MNMMNVRSALRAGAFCVLSAIAGVAGAQTAKEATAGDFPSRSLRFVIGFLPGGVSDTIARILSVKLGDELNQRIVVDGRPGAGGSCGG